MVSVPYLGLIFLCKIMSVTCHLQGKRFRPLLEAYFFIVDLLLENPLDAFGFRPLLGAYFFIDLYY